MISDYNDALRIARQAIGTIPAAVIETIRTL